MVVNIGKDCWNIIYDFKYQLEHTDKLSKSFDIIKTKVRRLYIRGHYEGWFFGNLY